MRRTLLWLAGIVIAMLMSAAYAADKPNILFIVSDDTGYGDLGRELLVPVTALGDWARHNIVRISAARAKFDSACKGDG